MIQIRLNGRSLYSFLSARLTGLPCTQVSLYVRVIPPRALSAISNKRGLQASKTRLFPSAPALRDCARYVSNASFEMGLRAPDLACSRSAITASHLRPSEIGSRFEQYLHKLRAKRVAGYRLGGLLVLRLSVCGCRPGLWHLRTRAREVGGDGQEGGSSLIERNLTRVQTRKPSCHGRGQGSRARVLANAEWVSTVLMWFDEQF
jgi:hypothetical protein